MQNLTTQALEDNRNRQRFAINPPLQGSFGATAISLINIGERGVKIEHADPLRLGTGGRLTFRFPRSEQPISLRAIVLWSHLSQTPDAAGKYLYESGLQLTGDLDLTGKVVQHLNEVSAAYPERDSMLRKRVMLKIKAERQVARIQYIHQPKSTVDPDELLLIQHAREQLMIRPDEATKWYNRARYAVPDAELSAVRHKEDVLAVWEFLDRTVSIERIAEAFERKG